MKRKRQRCGKGFRVAVGNVPPAYDSKGDELAAGKPGASKR
ncbi:MAG TPA: hypothetical protein VH040_17050 [Usitatibacter sp.]|nr:hypothetical protein [Usitatibacter sp.]